LISPALPGQGYLKGTVYVEIGLTHKSGVDTEEALHMAESTAAVPNERVSNRWVILLASVISMIAVANFQYGWTLFVSPLQKQLKAEQALIQVTFTVFVLLETWLVPFEGWLVDRFGPRLLVMLGGLLAGLGWVLSGKAGTLTALYLAYGVAGLGAGIVYGTAIGSALKWFPDHRGLAAGLTAAGFGAGAALTVQPIANMINSAGYQATFIRWGIIQGIVVIIAAMFLKAPPSGWLPQTWRSKGSEEVRTRQAPISFTPAEMASTPHFWLMYLMMTMVATGGLMATAQLAPMAKDFKVDNVNVTFLFWSGAALPLALSLDRLLNGLCRPAWGWVSDHIGREKTMTLAFGLEAIAIYALISFAHRPLLFVLFSAVTFFGWGEIYSLFPALCGDFFGRKFATANYGFLYTAKGTASVFIPIGSALAAGKAFDFRADILLVLGGLLVVFVVFLAPTVFRLNLGAAKPILLAVAGALVAYGLVLTVVPAVWTPFQAKFAVPKAGWSGVFKVAIVFDSLAAILAFFVLRRMKAPVKAAEERAITAGMTAPAA
jgi:MFS transporter, OFA family, oxalate/formate antiporter